jgi:hypothetical protein
MPFHWPSSRYLLGVPRQKPGESRLELTSQTRLDPVPLVTNLTLMFDVINFLQTPQHVALPRAMKGLLGGG